MSTFIAFSFGTFALFALPLLSIESGMRRLSADGDDATPTQGGADPESARERN